MSGNGYEFVGGSFPGARPDLYRLHRETIASLIASLPTEDTQSICILGSGGCRDLDLRGLAKRFASIDLVDLNVSPTVRAVSALHESVQSGIRVIEAEVTGARQAFENYQSSPSKEALEKIAAKLANSDNEVCGRWHQNETTVSDIRIASGNYDVVLSTCLLSQLMRYACECVGPDETNITNVAPLIRTNHLELLLTLTRAGGNAILVTDVTSSDALPEISQPDSNAVKLMAEHVVNGNNHFHGMKPQLIKDVLKSSPVLVRDVAKSQHSRPWIWNADNRSYLCFAIRMLKRSE